MKKPLWKKWWVWLITIIVLGGIGNIFGGDEVPVSKKEAKSVTNVEKKEKPKKEKNIQAVVNINSILNKSENDVNGILGNPSNREEKEFRLSGTETKVPAITSLYKNKALEVMFIKGAPQRITFTPNEDLKYPKNIKKAFEMLGFKNVKVGNQTDLATDVKLDGVYNAKIFNNQGKVDYIYLIVNEKYQ
ncbi:hypothetical protein V7146_16200 [Gottfriedia acidiceleris]|uniref:hypothetical protein n=1 Tax=Gottfriedia acidiceleris TaxID=371036 RepID=UPI002FFFD084